MSSSADEQLVKIGTGEVELEGSLRIPEGAPGVVIFAHGSGSGRHSPRNQFVARSLRHARLDTLLMDLLTAEEEHAERDTAHLRFNVDLLAERLVAATDWLHRTRPGLAIGYFGASTGAAAALVAAASRPDDVRAIVSRGGRPDLAGPALASVRAPTLLIVGSHDYPVVKLNRQALGKLACSEKNMITVTGATHLFEEPGALEEVAFLASGWFARYLAAPAASVLRDG